MISNQKALAAAQTIVDFCHQQKSCQNCIFRLFGADSWKCHIDAFDLQDVLSNISAKKEKSRMDLRRLSHDAGRSDSLK